MEVDARKKKGAKEPEGELAGTKRAAEAQRKMKKEEQEIKKR